MIKRFKNKKAIEEKKKGNKLDKLIALLISKGIITKDELK